MNEDQCRIWVVWGGVFTDSRFAELEPGTEEFYGPFHDEGAAVQAWKAATMQKVDVASHRLTIMLAQPVKAAARASAG